MLNTACMHGENPWGKPSLVYCLASSLICKARDKLKKKRKKHPTFFIYRSETFVWQLHQALIDVHHNICFMFTHTHMHAQTHKRAYYACTHMHTHTESCVVATCFLTLALADSLFTVWLTAASPTSCTGKHIPIINIQIDTIHMYYNHTRKQILKLRQE